MKTRKQGTLLGVLVIIALVCTVIACGSDDGKNHDDGYTQREFNYEIIPGTNNITITGYNGNGGNVVIPSQIDGKTVVAIADDNNGVFHNKGLTSVTIPNSVTTIGNLAFAGYYDNGSGEYVGNQLTSVTIPNSVTSIGAGAFQNNPLTSVTIGNSVTTIGRWAFAYNQLTSVAIPNSVTTIGEYAFSNNQLTSITIPNSVTTIGELAFNGNQLTSVTIGNSVTSIGQSAFAGNQLTSVIIPNSVISLSGFGGNRLTSITIPNNVTSIGRYAFTDNQLLTSVTFRGIIAAENFGDAVGGFPGAFDGDLRAKYLAGGIATYTTANPGSNAVWTRQGEYGIGSTGPGGGIIFYYSASGFYMSDTGELCHYLEAAPAFMVTMARWSTATSAPYISISGTGAAIGTGRRNTALILSLDPTAPAAKLCSDYRGGGKDDWFLPSKDELNQLRYRRTAEDYYGNEYWSSSQSSSVNAWRISIGVDNNSEYEIEKGNQRSVRAVRAF
jgi:hypothetical protein